MAILKNMCCLMINKTSVEMKLTDKGINVTLVLEERDEKA